MLRKWALVSFVGLAMVGGCGDLPDFLNAVGKLTSSGDPPIGDLTAPEIVSLTNHKTDIAPFLHLTQQQLDALPVIDEATAQTMVDFLAANKVRTVSDLQTLADNINSGAVQVQIPATLQDLITGMGYQL